jgi:hypothetical protein
MQIHYQLATSKKGVYSVAEYVQWIKNLSDTLSSVGQPLNGFETFSCLQALFLSMTRLLL